MASICLGLNVLNTTIWYFHMALDINTDVQTEEMEIDSHYVVNKINRNSF